MRAGAASSGSESAGSESTMHTVLVRPTAFQSTGGSNADKRLEFQAFYRELVQDEPRNRDRPGC
jgi:hypothetical protein